MTNISQSTFNLPASTTNGVIFYNYETSSVICGTTTSYNTNDTPIAIFTTTSSGITSLNNYSVKFLQVVQSSAGEYGTGVYGTVTMNGSTTYSSFSSLTSNIYTLTADLYCTNLTISASVSIYENGFRVFVNGLLTLNSGSSINCNGGNSSGSTAGTGTTSNVLGNGGAGASASSNTTGTASTAISSYFAGGLGGNGGAGTNSGGTTPASTVVPVTEGGIYCLTALPTCITGCTILKNRVNGGSGGSSGGSKNNTGSATGGGGGGGAGVCMVIAKNITIVSGTAYITANGGTGGNGVYTSNGIAGGGGGGGGGVCIVVSRINTSLLGSSLSITSNGGSGGTAANGGVAGSSGANGQVITLIH